MDAFKRTFYENRFELGYLKHRGEAFQDFFSTIMELRYPGQFQRTRPWGNIGDRKNDGYLPLPGDRMLFQVYAPDEMDASRAIKKIDEDFYGALPHWQSYFDTWVFVHNARNGIGPHIVQKLAELNQAHPSLSFKTWSYNELRTLVFTLNEYDIAHLLGSVPSPYTMAQVGFREIQEVLNVISIQPPKPEQDLRPVSPEKLQRNGLSSDSQRFLKLGIGRANLIREYFAKHHDPTYGDALAASYRQHYLSIRELGLSPDLIFKDLWRLSGGGQQETPVLESAVLAVLAHFFEECDIFERVPDEEAP